MTKQEAKEYANKRFEEINLTDPVQKVNIILQELARMGFTVYIHESMPAPVKGISLGEGEIVYHV